MDYQSKVLILMIAFTLTVVAFMYIAHKFGADLKRESVQMIIALLALIPTLMVLSWLAQLKWWGILLTVLVGCLSGLSYFKILIKTKKVIHKEKDSR